MQQILDNRTKGAVGEYLKKQIDKGAKLSIVSAYFTIFAFDELKLQLSNIKDLRFLFSEPTFVREGNHKEHKEFEILKHKRETAISELGMEIRLKNNLSQKSIATECAEWIMKKVEMRSLTKQEAVQGNTFLVSNKNGEHAAIVGSADFTTNGLGYGTHTSLGFNMATSDHNVVEQLLSSFDAVWDDPTMTTNVKDQILEQLSNLFIENSPESIYMLTLFHIFRSFVEESDANHRIQSAIGLDKTEIWSKLYHFQRDAVIGGINKLEKFGGCIIADSVGLGKTFEALAVIKYYELRNSRVLVLAPKKLRRNWEVYKGNDISNILENDRLRYDILNHTDLSRTSGKSGDITLETLNWGNYDLVVIDESHNFRNNEPAKGRMTRYEKLMQDIIKTGVKTKVLLLSATPVNNRLNDLKNQIAFITEGNDAALAKSAGIRSISSTLNQAQRKFNAWSKLKDSERKVERFLDSLGMDYFNLLNTLTIARSRKHIQKYYNTEEIGEFPTRLVPINIKSDIDLQNQFPSLEVINNTIRRLKLALYSPLSYVLPEKRSEYSQKYDKQVGDGKGIFKQVDRESSLIHLMRVNLLKRLESSVHSFGLTVNKIKLAVDSMIHAIEQGQTMYDPQLNILDLETDEGQLEELLIGNKVKVLIQDLDLIKLKQDLLEDRKYLQTLFNAAHQVEPSRDTKLADLKQIIQQKNQIQINEGNKKIIIFTAFSDTAEYLYGQIAPWIKEQYQLESALITGDGQKTTLKGIKTEFNLLLTHFSPLSKGLSKLNASTKKEIDILIATDCISEGQNLQDCDYLINYDIHWNPVRIIQRFGRIDRLGSVNKAVQLVNFWPNVALDEYIQLEARVNNRMVMLDISATGEENIIVVDGKSSMNDLEYRRKQLQQLQTEVLDLEDLSGGISITDLTLDDFKMDLALFIQEYPKKLESMPTGVHALVPIPDKVKNECVPGVVFCLKQTTNSNRDIESSGIYPYYLVYVSDQGDIHLTHTSAKAILDLYKGLCNGEEQVYRDLCDVFNNETKDGAKMDVYTELLEQAVTSIIGVNEEKGLQSLFSLGGTSILGDKINGLDDFELLSFLIIK
ncbi:SNF2 family DNA or RNA helicase [Paenibacillus endophyticus]|uniref:SNF2 family DNA or RNA helicase n=1 Tax=Paenibacillus endophyticus TaxID=1294268 RepID=A0A7W5G9R8_9BACL|nr:helicase-related protein [Paenibacillus endophyticus]MBB3152469.1 SNF2 family DNA or RNA helicase [Paenibacillus endophyticus]